MQQCAGADPSGQFRPDGEINEDTFYPCLAEREDRPHPRVDHRVGVMLAWLRALREWLLRRNRRPGYALGSRIPWPGGRVLVRVLRQDRSASAQLSVALCPSR